MAGEIEFLEPESAPGGDEYLPSQGGREGYDRTRRVALGAGIVALILGVLVTRAVTGNDGSSSAASVVPSVAATAGTSAIPTSPLGGSTLSSGPTGDAAVPMPTLCSLSGHHARVEDQCVSASAAQCPEGTDGSSECYTVKGLPAAVFTAVRAQFPSANVSSAFTEIARETDLVWYRTFTVTLTPDVSIEITLEQSGNDPGKTGVRDYSDLEQEVRAVHVGPHLNTIIEYAGPFGPVTLGDLSMLATNARLATVS